ncbi:ribonuclease P protein subunit p30 [Ischnura elegans]|uniref:ribonuclease P protein subunit p30 n=1 Tax=Ischnura elegans TaxID=197161 RepID=UPI001ED8791C|nr:ribonuclease P protein subunit p30 [Ischnura elegans]
MDKLGTWSGFFDLNVKYNKSTVKKTIETAIQLGYKVIAIDTVLEESAFETKKKKKGEPRDNVDIVPAPIDLHEILGDSAKDVKILHRLTIEFVNSLQAHKLSQSENFKKYEIVAVIPVSQSTFQYACSSMDVDIISFKPEDTPQFRISRKMYAMATDRGIYFELMYSPAVHDSNSRKNIISLSHLYHAVGKSQNIIVTSNAESPFDLRGPYDVINLCLIFGMTEELAKRAISDSCRTLCIRSVGRRCGKAVVWVSRIPSSEDEVSSGDDELLTDQLCVPVKRKERSVICSGGKESNEGVEFLPSTETSDDLNSFNPGKRKKSNSKIL